MENNKQMIDIVLKEYLSENAAKEFLSFVFNSTVERIMFVSMERFCSMEETDFSSVDCLCVVSRVQGDASQLFQLYRYSLPENELIPQLQNACQKYGVNCYVPEPGHINSWYFISKNSVMKQAQQVEVEEQDYYKFQLC